MVKQLPNFQHRLIDGQSRRCIGTGLTPDPEVTRNIQRSGGISPIEDLTSLPRERVITALFEQADLLAVVDRARTGSPEAISDLYGKYGKLVHRVAYGLTRSSADADDIVQEVFGSLPRRLRSFQGAGSFSGWIRKVAVTTSLMQMRAGRRRKEEPLPDLAIAAGSPDGHEDRMAIESALRALPERLRSVFVLKLVEGYSHEEIAEFLKISPASSRISLYRARKQLQRLLS